MIVQAPKIKARAATLEALAALVHPSDRIIFDGHSYALLNRAAFDRWLLARERETPKEKK